MVELIDYQLHTFHSPEFQNVVDDAIGFFNNTPAHARSIQQVTNLHVEDFQCRFMILTGVDSDLLVPVEAELIRRHRPLWNTVVDGFGNHDPGAGRYNQARSEWDILHPGRPWAERLTGESLDIEKVIEKVWRSLPQSPLP